MTTRAAARTESPVADSLIGTCAVSLVWFDFAFLNATVTHRGSESWQMVRAQDGWKISAMQYLMGD